MSKGKVVTNEAKQFVINFFEDDNISRQCPGKKDCISVLEENGVKRLKQKRLVLGNLKELFEEFKKLDDRPDIGFSTFCSLRPKHCVLAGSSGLILYASAHTIKIQYFSSMPLVSPIFSWLMWWERLFVTSTMKLAWWESAINVQQSRVSLIS